MARKSILRGPDRPPSLAEPTSARSTALDQTTSRADVDDSDRRSSDDAGRSDNRKIPIQHYASGTSHLSTLRWGYALVFGSANVLAIGLWSILIGPLCEPTGIKVMPAPRLHSARIHRGWTRLTSGRLGTHRSCSTSWCKTITTSTSSSSSFPSPFASSSSIGGASRSVPPSPSL